MPVLHEYLTKLHDTSLSTEEKMRIYQRYLDKSHRVLLRRKVAYYSRVTVFSLATLVLFAGGFYLFMPGNSPYVMNELDSGLVALQQKNGAYVHAEPVGRIITARGDIVITNAEGEQIDGSDIHSNDTILLQAGGEILLTVSNGFQAKIIGPAKFMIEDAGFQGDVHIYTINLLEGDYLQLAKIQDPIPTDTSRSGSDQSTPPKESVIVKTDDFHLEQLHASSDLDIIISTTQEGKKTITNHGDDILVKKIVRDDEKKIYAAVGEDETVLVNGDIELVEEDVVELVQDITDQQLAIRYDLEQDKPADEIEDAPSDATSASSLNTLLGSSSTSKQVLDEEKMAGLTATLSLGNVKSDLDDITTAYVAGDTTAFALAYTSLTRKIQRAGEILEISLPAMPVMYDRLDAGVIASQQILTYVEGNYYLPPATTNALSLIVSSLQSLQTTSFGQSVSLPREDEEEYVGESSQDIPQSEEIKNAIDVESVMSTE